MHIMTDRTKTVSSDTPIHHEDCEQAELERMYREIMDLRRKVAVAERNIRKTRGSTQSTF